LDIESNLIKYFSGDGKYKLLNGNVGLANHNYYQKPQYWEVFKTIWDQLRTRGVAQHSLEHIDNSDLFKYSPYKSLTLDQHDSILKIISQLSQKEKNTIFVEGGAGIKRRFMDWAMFHVEHSYLELWRSYRRILQHRNALLKLQTKDIINQLDIWDSELAKVGEEIHLHRKQLFQKYLPVLDVTVSDLLPSPSVSAEYKKGWQQDVSLRQALDESRQKDIKYRATSCGPHRADILLTCANSPVSEFLSRGQIKLLACAIKISMSKHLSNIKINNGITTYATTFLIDDLAAELDEYSSRSVLAALLKTNDQCIFTAITCEALSWVAELTETSGKFHVEHGKIKAIKPAG
jgi:DNA replication and repair protein RecF